EGRITSIGESAARNLIAQLPQAHRAARRWASNLSTRLLKIIVIAYDLFRGTARSKGSCSELGERTEAAQFEFVLKRRSVGCSSSQFGRCEVSAHDFDPHSWCRLAPNFQAALLAVDGHSSE